MANGNKPVKKIRIGYTTATIWKNGEHHNVVLSKAFKDNGEWRDTDQLGSGDLLNAAKCLERSEAWIAEQQQ